MVKVLIKPITPKVDFLEPEKWRRAVVNAGNMSSKAVKVDFQVTTKTWADQPIFDIIHNLTKLEWTIKTDDKIYAFVDEGTRAHIIRPKKPGGMLRFFTGGRPKSRVGWIGSNKGAPAKKGPVVTRIVHHPGTEARRFAKTIKAKWDIEWPRQISRAIRAVLRYGGV